MYIVCFDMEGVFIPEVWINVAEKTGVEELRLTTRDIPDYDELMTRRLAILKEKGIRLQDIQDAISYMNPLPGALDFISWLRPRIPFLIVSDTYHQFAVPLLEKLGWPTLLCHTLTVDSDGNITDYNLRQPDSKRKVIISMKSINYQVIAVGDSYNDVNMLEEADKGILFCPPDNVRNEYSHLESTENYQELKKVISKTAGEV